MSTIQQMSFFPATVSRDAVIKGNYRYILRRWWGPDNEKILLWILLNPSTANAQADDATLRRVMSFTRREGYSKLDILNLFAFRSKKPADLRRAGDAIGPENNTYIRQAVARADKIIIGWGEHGRFQERDRAVLSLLPPVLWSFGTTKGGSPRHPLYLKSTEPLRAYSNHHSSLIGRETKE